MSIFTHIDSPLMASIVHREEQVVIGLMFTTA